MFLGKQIYSRTHLRKKVLRLNEQSNSTFISVDLALNNRTFNLVKFKTLLQLKQQEIVVSKTKHFLICWKTNNKYELTTLQLWWFNWQYLPQLSSRWFSPLWLSMHMAYMLMVAVRVSSEWNMCYKSITREVHSFSIGHLRVSTQPPWGVRANLAWGHFERTSMILFSPQCYIHLKQHFCNLNCIWNETLLSVCRGDIYEDPRWSI